MSESIFMKDIGGHELFRVIPSTSDMDTTSFSFVVEEVTEWELDDTPSGFQRYLYGTIKWDSCSHLYFGDEDGDGYLHLCGAQAFQVHAALMKFLYELAFERMGQKPQDGEEWS